MVITNGLLDSMQSSLRFLRNLTGLSQEAFGNLLGLSKVTIYQLEKKHTKLSKVEYIAIRFVLSDLAKKSHNEELLQYLSMY